MGMAGSNDTLLFPLWSAGWSAGQRWGFTLMSRVVLRGKLWVRMEL